MQSCWIVFLTLFIITIAIILARKKRESYGPGFPSVPLWIETPPNIKHTDTYLDFSDPKLLHSLCPTPPDAGKWCKNHSDCPGAAELCFNSAWGWVDSNPNFINPQPESNYCVCSIAGICQVQGIC